MKKFLMASVFVIGANAAMATPILTKSPFPVVPVPGYTWVGYVIDHFNSFGWTVAEKTAETNVQVDSVLAEVGPHSIYRDLVTTTSATSEATEWHAEFYKKTTNKVAEPTTLAMLGFSLIGLGSILTIIGGVARR